MRHSSDGLKDINGWERKDTRHTMLNSLDDRKYNNDWM